MWEQGASVVGTRLTRASRSEHEGHGKEQMGQCDGKASAFSDEESLRATFPSRMVTLACLREMPCQPPSVLNPSARR